MPSPTRLVVVTALSKRRVERMLEMYESLPDASRTVLDEVLTALHLHHVPRSTLAALPRRGRAASSGLSRRRAKSA